MSHTMWEERFSEDGYAYGEAPNNFLEAMASLIPPGRVLCLAEGEGRNAVFLAGQGYQVTAVDWSPAGLNKARQLAKRRGVNIQTVVADLAHFEFGRETWAGIVSIFTHFPESLRWHIHSAGVTALQPGGVWVMEIYAPGQMNFQTGGPRDINLLHPIATVMTELAGLEFLHAREIVRPVIEGKYHTGDAMVTQIVARKPVETTR